MGTLRDLVESREDEPVNGVGGLTIREHMALELAKSLVIAGRPITEATSLAVKASDWLLAALRGD